MKTLKSCYWFLTLCLLSKRLLPNQSNDTCSGKRNSTFLVTGKWIQFLITNLFPLYSARKSDMMMLNLWWCAQISFKALIFFLNLTSFLKEAVLVEYHLCWLDTLVNSISSKRLHNDYKNFASVFMSFFLPGLWLQNGFRSPVYDYVRPKGCDVMEILRNELCKPRR